MLAVVVKGCLAFFHNFFLTKVLENSYRAQ